MNFAHEVWAALLTEGRELKEDLTNLRELLDKDVERLLARPGVVKPLFTVLRKISPIFTAPHVAAVSLYPDVLDVLGDEASFSVVPIYAKKMEATTGDFVLGMDDTPQYETEIGIMRACVTAADVDRVRKLADDLAEAQVAAAEATGPTIDAVAQLSRFVPNAIVGEFFGTPGPDVATNERWMRSIFRDIFLNLGNDPNMHAQAAADAEQLRDYLDGLIAQRKSQLAAGETLPDDFLSRMVSLQAQTQPPFADEVIRRLVGGTTVGTVDTISKAVAQALDQLLSRPLTLQDARSAAASGNDDLFAAFVFEALRFNPQNPFLLRICTKNTVVAAGTSRSKVIHAGSLVLVGTESAMFDSDVFPEPDAFRADRPADKYIHFGHGLHECFGRHFAGVTIPAILKPLILRPGLQRISGTGITYDGAFPNSFPVALR